MPGHVGQDLETALGVVKVLVLDASLDDVEGRRHDQRGRRAGDGGDEVLEPRRLVVVLQREEELLGKGRTAEQLWEIESACLDRAFGSGVRGREWTYRKRARGVSGRRPLPSSVQAEPLVLDDLDNAAATEGLGVGLALDLEDVKRQ